MPTPLPSPDALPSQGPPVEIPSWIQTYLAHGDEEQRAIAQDALDALTTPAKVSAVCLHCKQFPASKAEDDKGFTLCDACYHKSNLGPVVELAATLAEMQLSEAQQLAGELGRWKHCFRRAARDLLYHGPKRDLPEEQFNTLGPGELARDVNNALIRLEAVCDEASEVRYLCQQMGVKVVSDGKPIPLVDLLRHILVSDVDYGNRYSLLQRAETEEGRAVEYEESAAQCRDDAAKYRRWARGETP